MHRLVRVVRPPPQVLEQRDQFVQKPHRGGSGMVVVVVVLIVVQGIVLQRSDCLLGPDRGFKEIWADKYK